MTFFHTFRYHQTLAPQGQRFTDEAEFNALGPEWVDTPTKFPEPSPVVEVVASEPLEMGDLVVIDGAHPKRGRKAKETTV